MLFKVMESKIEGDYLSVRVRGWEGPESAPIIVIEDMVIINRKDIIKEELLDAITNGVQINESLHYVFSPDEIMVKIDEDGIKVELNPIKPNSNTAILVLAKKINDRLIKLSRAMTTIAINRINIKLNEAKKTQSYPFDIEEKEILNQEMKVSLKQRRLSIFAKRRELNIPEDLFKTKAIEITGKNNSSEWTWEDMTKISEFFNLGV